MIVCKLGIPPSEFWKMTPFEAMLLIEDKAPEPKVGNLTYDQYERLEKKREELIRKGVNVL